MLIKTKITFTDETKSDLIGKTVNHSDEILIDLANVSAVMPGDQKGETSIIFLHGRDILITHTYSEASFLWMKTKEDLGIHFHTKKDEG